ncbi:hypothetical protein EJ05DRAFT_472300 [Pseudovirgaria hyperparasitica]|uniref:UbiA prenyltransferase n=1 Tax=Pseudovirgaria hyperparasitica TaxID=470096 RepID=A0A6A6WME5_9PEZI|nr:uncharacterized protein EJ05DRAFT_472300 [Pseudovirgaria hyperparasitica]KAF2763390.1 hypothetical protein EJ05DRAFT_472300 [Pseudovirgaria hyperparasitica]
MAVPFKASISQTATHILKSVLTPPLSYHLRTFWLFSYSDFKTIIIPSTIFGITNGLAASSYNLQPLIQLPTSLFILLRTPIVLFWVWLNYIAFAINNQSSDSSIAEDAVNKPWRPLPSKRLTQTAAKGLMWACYTLALLGSRFMLGGASQALGLVVLGAWYNNFDGANADPLIRNLINAGGYVCFTSGALEVAIGGARSAEGGAGCLGLWLMVVAGVIATTIQTADMYDQEGDALRGRKTMPLVVGDWYARWTIAVPMGVWGFVCPMFWGVGWFGVCMSGSLAWSVALRTLLLRNVRDDKVTFLIWNVWMSVVFVLPLFAY